MPFAIIASYLQVAAILAQAHRKHFLLDQPILVHHLVDWSEQVGTAILRLHRHAQDPICLLRVEQIGLLLHAAESVLEVIVARVILLTQVNLIPHNVAIIETALRVSLIKLAVVMLCALTAVIFTLAC